MTGQEYAMERVKDFQRQKAAERLNRELLGKEETQAGAVGKSTRLTVERAAELMGVSRQMIRMGLKDKIFPFGYAIQMSAGRYTYYISAKKFTEATGIEIPEE